MVRNLAQKYGETFYHHLWLIVKISHEENKLKQGEYTCITKPAHEIVYDR